MKIELVSHHFNSILINEKKTVYLPHKIEAFRVFKTVFIIVFNIENSIENYDQNVFCYDEFGKQIWKIKKDSSNYRYVGIERENDLLVAINFSTNALIIEPETGSVLREEWRK